MRDYTSGGTESMALQMPATPQSSEGHIMRWVLYFDMRSPEFGASRSALYSAALEMGAWAEQTGASSLSVPEHHFETDGYVPSPAVLAGALAARTSTIPLAISAIPLPLHDPVRIAEDVLVVDQISGGRLAVVIVPGYSESEFEGYGVDYAARAQIFEEKAKVFMRAVSGEAVGATGSTVVTPAAVNPPRVPVLFGGASPAAARRAARMGDGFAPAVADERLVEIYRATCESLGRVPSPVVLPYGPMHLFVSDDPERDRQQLAPHVAHELDAYRAIGADNRSYDSADTMEAMSSRGSFPVVTPDEAIELVQALPPETPLTMKPLIAGLDPDLAWRSLERFANAVLPVLTGSDSSSVPASTRPANR